MKPTIPQGTRDFDAVTVHKRQYIFNTIKNVFELHGYQPLETPAIENIETLTGKYGEEGDKLIFKILNNGINDPKNIAKATAAFENVVKGKSDKNLTERALRYDLTIPFARYVAMNYNQLPTPFKRYQIQPVWRADRPQKGRYREFFQCDADIVGSTSLLNELELTAIYGSVFQKLNISVEIRINNRKILAGLATLCGGADKLIDITIAIDKLDKIGLERVKQELKAKQLSDDQIYVIENFLTISGNNEEKLQQLKNLFVQNEVGIQGIEELQYIISNSNFSSVDTQLIIDPKLARGLNYYTGTIFEIKAIGVKMGSIGGGGRYDDLTSLFGVPNVPGVGISFGVDRIYDVMEELNLFPPQLSSSIKLLFFNMGDLEVSKAVELAALLRAQGIACEVYPDKVKMDKQFKYAEKKNIAYAAIIGSQELEEHTVNIKHLATGNQQTLSFVEITDTDFYLILK